MYRKSKYSNPNGACVEVDDYRKSTNSHANGSYVEVGTGYRKSSRSAYNGSCVEVASGVRVRDTMDRDGFILHVPGNAWKDFTDAIKDGRLALSPRPL